MIQIKEKKYYLDNFPNDVYELLKLIMILNIAIILIILTIINIILIKYSSVEYPSDKPFLNSDYEQEDI